MVSISLTITSRSTSTSVSAIFCARCREPYVLSLPRQSTNASSPSKNTSCSVISSTCKTRELSVTFSICKVSVWNARVSCYFHTYPNFRLYFYMAAQIAQLAGPIWIALTGQLGQSMQQWRNISSEVNFSAFIYRTISKDFQTKPWLFLYHWQIIVTVAMQCLL